MDKHIGHCIKCRDKKEIKDPMPYKQRNSKTKNKMVNMIKGRCPDCNGIIYVVVGHG
jgi:hypothetical protein